MEFQEALRSEDINTIRAIAKSDLHNHGLMGGRREMMETLVGCSIPRFSYGNEGVSGINRWIMESYAPLFQRSTAFENGIRAAFLQAKSDGVTVLEMSVDAGYGLFFRLTPFEIVDILKRVHEEIGPEIEFRPEIGFSRSKPLRSLMQWFAPLLETGYFKCIDLYDLEDAQPVRNFKELFRFARENGLKCKAHAGEFGNAESVRETVEELEVDAIQHGIGAATSPEVMRWLASRGVVLNVCPQSNIVLGRTASYATHPIRILYDHGIRVTVNTDDLMLFEYGNSEQFLELYRNGVFGAEELDEIRNNGL